MIIKLKNGSEMEFNAGISILEAAKKISPSLAKKALIAQNNNIEKNLFDTLEEGTLNLISEINEIRQQIINNSALNRIVKVLKEKYQVKIIGFESNDEEFFIDFESKEKLSGLEINKIISNAQKNHIEAKDLINSNQIIINKPILIKIVSFGGLEELNTNRIRGFGAKNQEQLTIIEEQIKEREERDHRKIGKELEIFMISEEAGKGFPIWLPNGVYLKNRIRDFIFEQEEKYNYMQVETPVVGSLDFYKTSGHYSHYKDSMFPVMEIEPNEEFILRPMACPHHCLIYKSKPRSYRELPFKVAEQVHQYRYEASGALLGLERVRAMELTDSHIFLKMDQLENQLKEVYELIASTLDKFEIKIKYLELALHDPNDKDKYHGDATTWNKSEQILRNFLTNNNIKFIEKSGEAAFYGPKIDIQIETALKHIITVSTIQLDFFLPERFDLNYINSDNELERVIMIHRGLIGTYERFISVLLEQSKGNLPMWLAPRQAVIIPVSNEQHIDYAKKVYQMLKAEKVQVVLDDSNERMGYKIRKYQTNKTKIQIVLGDNEVANKTITYREYGKNEEQTIPLSELVKLFK